MSYCHATTSRGFRCINLLLAGETLCPSHDPSKQCGAPTVSGRPCRRMKSFGSNQCSYHQGES